MLSLIGVRADAQFAPTSTLFIKITPDFPEPGVNVTAELISYNTDLDLASITWTLDGKVILTGAGSKQVSFTSASIGSKNTLKAVAIDPGGQTYQTSIIIRPARVTMLIEAKSRVPVWYKGAALPSADGRVLVTAVPEFYSGASKINPALLIYEWRVDGEIKRGLSGKGKQNISVLAPGAGSTPKDIEVKISSSDGTMKQQGFASIKPYPVELLFYERSSSGLITSGAIKTKVISPGTKFEVEAVPFFVNYQSSSDLSYSWRQNGNSISPLSGRPQALSVEALSGTGGEGAQIDVIITNAKNIFEKIYNYFDVEVK
ncbi:hypothetical protein HYT00_03285 [Candidatus Giovannonibacteria bacterium]|nr:hypothetical protein [Candidatus Giovannonibacteria bacterium]